MQSLPVTATPPATPAQAPTPTDNTAQAAEPFGSVLARQRANAGADSQKPDSQKPISQKMDSQKPDSQKLDSKKSDSKPLSSANDAIANEPAIDLQVATADAASMLPSDMLASLLPASTITGSPSGKEKTGKEKIDPQTSAPDGVSTLPSDMLALLLPATAATDAAATVAKTAAAATVATAAATTAATTAVTSRTGINEKDPQESMSDGGKKARSQPIATAALGETRQSAVNKVASEVLGGVSAPLSAQGSARAEAAGIDTSNTFAAALEASGKDGAKTAQLDTAAMKISAQPLAPAALDSLLQSGIAPVASPNGPAQAVQAAINTPVTHEAWGDEFSQKITWMATQHEQTAELHLNPPNLGPLDVVLNVSGDQATALFTSPHAAVRDALEQALPKLREMLADNGITLGNAMVSDQSPKDQQAWQAEQRQKGNGGAKVDASVVAGSIPSGATIMSGRRHQGMVDTFA